MPADFPGAFSALRAILKKHGAGMVVLTDTPTDYTLQTRATGPNKKPMWFGGVMLKKSAVTFHLIALYYNPALERTLPPALLARKQGKACFNFQRPDPELFAMLDALTEQVRRQWERHGFLEPGPISQERLGAALRAAGEDPVALAKLRRSKGRAAAKKRAATLRARQSGQPQVAKRHTSRRAAQ